jgi:two-component system, OmpR family, KDP operon response regulator KdpE
MAATLRRTRPAPAAAGGGSTIHLGDVTIDLEAQLVRRCGVAVRLTPTEFALLRELALNKGQLMVPAGGVTPKGYGPRPVL